MDKTIAQMKIPLHVLPGKSGQWKVRVQGAARAKKVFSRQEDAVEYARKMSKGHADIYLHGPDGEVLHKVPKLYEIVALLKYAVVILADSREQAMEHIKTWERAWAEGSDLVGVSDVEVADVREGVAEDAHEVTTKYGSDENG